MALVNPNIALGFRMPEFQPRNALAEYAQIQQIQGGQQTQELNALKMQEAQRAVQQTNALNQAYQTAYNPETGEIDANVLRRNLSTGGFGSSLPALEKSLSEIEQQKLTRQKLQGEVKLQPTTLAAANVKLLNDKLAQQRSFLDTLDPTDPNAPARYIQWHEANHADPDIGAALRARGITVEQSRDQIQRAIAAGPQAFATMINQSKLGTEEFMRMNKPTTTTINQGGQTQLVQTPGLGGVSKSVGTFADVPLPINVAEQKKAIARAGASNITNKQEGAFESGLGTGQSKRILDNQVVAQDAAAILETNQVGRDLLKSGAIVGTGADFFVGFNNALKQAGIDFGYADAAANSQAYAAAMGANVGRIIKQFGAGTGLSDADREYAAQMAGGKISLTEAALRRILDINDKAANRVIDLHNKNVSGIKTNIPLTVDKPTFTRQKSAVDQIPSQVRPAANAADPLGIR